MVQIPLAARIFVFVAIILGLYMAAPNFWERTQTLTDDEGVVIGENCFVPSPFLCRQINLGLDLQGGVSATLEVPEDQFWADIFRDERRGMLALANGDNTLFQSMDIEELGVEQTDDRGWTASYRLIGDATSRDLALAYTVAPYIQMIPEGADEFTLRVSGFVRDQQMALLTERLIEGLRNRFDAFGISEPIIRDAGQPGRVNVELPGATRLPPIPAGNLQLCSVPLDYTGSTLSGVEFLPAVNPGSFDVGGATRVAIDFSVRCVESEDIIGAAAALEGPNAQVNVQLRPAAGVIMNNLTRPEWANGRRFLAVILDGEVIRFDSFEPNLGTSFRIRGTSTIDEASTLATILRAGALPAGVEVLEESKVGAELGEAAIQAGQFAAILAVVAVLIYMAVSYGVFGLFADLALLVNLGLILGLMTLLGFTLSLPGIAGIVLTIGMAVDANVLVFERMREVWRKTGNVGQAIENGYGQALSTILDANITTFIAALVLFLVGKGAIQGFAVTLTIGILTSIFSALLFTRMLIGFWFGSGRRLAMPI